MMKKIIYLTILCAVAILNTVIAQEHIFPKGEKAPNVHHTGDVWLTHVSNADETFDYNIAHAAFAPGAKLDWHMHPKGQQLLITEGKGYYQERGKPVQLVQIGDIVKCFPRVEHWHAATPDSDFAYLAVTGNEPTKWLEKLTDEVYNSIKIEENELEQKIIALSKEKWQWMADKEADKLADLFHEQAKFVHMGGTWGKDREVSIIRSGDIHYKKADIHEASIEIIDDTAIIWNRITLLAVVAGNEVTNPFMVTEVYKKQDNKWKLANMSFTKLLSSDR